LSFPERQRKQSSPTISDATLWSYIDNSLNVKDRAQVERLLMEDKELYSRYESILADHDVIIQYIPAGNLGENKRNSLLKEVESSIGPYLEEQKQGLIKRLVKFANKPLF
jgi:anti-sigma factor RsiW